MPRLPTWTGRSTFQYTGSVQTGTAITYGKGFRVKVSGPDYSHLIRFFSGSTVDIGTSRTNLPAGGLGNWLQSNVIKRAIASYVGPILINEGYAEKVGESKIGIK